MRNIGKEIEMAVMLADAVPCVGNQKTFGIRRLGDVGTHGNRLIPVTRPRPQFCNGCRPFNRIDNPGSNGFATRIKADHATERLFVMGEVLGAIHRINDPERIIASKDPLLQSRVFMGGFFAKGAAARQKIGQTASQNALSFSIRNRHQIHRMGLGIDICIIQLAKTRGNFSSRHFPNDFGHFVHIDFNRHALSPYQTR